MSIQVQALECSVEGCSRSRMARGYCHMHWRRWRKSGNPGEAATRHVARETQCTVTGCSNTNCARGYCAKHYRRWKLYGDPILVQRAYGRGSVQRGGYRVLHRPGHPDADKNGRIAEHRLVLEQALGRRLRREETVHHINGDRLDNRLENLELWSANHPSGQRVTDKILWGLDFLNRYAPEMLSVKGRNIASTQQLAFDFLFDRGDR